MTASKKHPLEAAVVDLSKAKTVDIKGKQYATVATRIEIFRRHFPDHTIATEIHPHNGWVRAKAEIADEKGRTIAIGHAEEDRSKGINKTSAVENAETSAVGRALALFGLAGNEIASADEVAEAIAQQGGDRPWFGPLTKTQLNAKSREMFKELQACEDVDQLDALLHSDPFNQFIDQVKRDQPRWWTGFDDQVGWEVRIAEARDRCEANDLQREPAMMG